MALQSILGKTIVPNIGRADSTTTSAPEKSSDEDSKQATVLLLFRFNVCSSNLAEFDFLQAPEDDRAAAFNPQHPAYNSTTQNAGSAMASRSQTSRDARSAAYNPQHPAYNPTSTRKGK
jgi:flagellar basal body rod protein FlgC